MSTPAVETTRLTHRYGAQPALQDVSLRIPPGALFGLLGPNGGGKTTLFRILSTLMGPTEGTAKVFGHDVRDEPSAVRRQMGVIFQQSALDDELTVQENMAVHGALYGLKGKALRARIDLLLARFGLQDRAGDRVKTLSGGLQRRVDLSRGLLHAPALLLLDEPTTGLDPVARRAFWEALDRLRRDEGTTFVVATHLLEEAERCDAIGILDRGRLVAHGTPNGLKAELGDESLWLETDAPEDLCDRIQARFGLPAQVIGASVQVTTPEPHARLGALYEAFSDRITSATVRRPTLEDVFLIHAGYRLGESNTALEANL